MDTKQPQVTEEQVKETDRFWENPQNIMNLIDLLFLYDDDPDRIKVCS